MTITQTGGNLTCPEHKDALPEGGDEEVNLRDGLAGMVGEQVRKRKLKDEVKTVISCETPTLILYLNNPVMIANIFIFLFMYCVY